MQFTRGLNNRFASTVLSAVAVLALSVPAYAQTVTVKGNSRVDAETIRSYFPSTDAAGVTEGTQSLKATGLFSNVNVSRQGSNVLVTVVENNVINRVAFEGNSKLKSDQLLMEVQTKARGAYSPSIAQSDVERIKEIYRRGGRGDANIKVRTVDLPNGRIDVVFTIDEGSKTGVYAINFTGNTAFSSGRLRDLMQTTEMNYLSWLKTSDVYDPDKIAADQELIRRYYLKNGYADFSIVSSDAVYDEAKKGWILTIAVDEGAQYRVGSVDVESRLADVSADSLRKVVTIKAGDVYNGDKVEKTVDALTREVARSGYAFTSARPRGDRNPAAHTIALSFVLEEGPRVYVERINIRGNSRTREYVLRREFDLGEGDAYNRVLVDRAERRLKSLGYFKNVRITNEPGSAPDRVVINVDVEDQPTGSFAISAGYSTTDGIIGEVSITEQNFLGRGQFVRAALSMGQRTRGIDLSFTEPYLWGRVGGGIDLFAKRNINSRYSLYDTTTVGTSLRLGFPLTEEISFAPRYSIYQSKITIPNDGNRPYNDCSVPIDGVTPAPGSVTEYSNCLTNGEASLAIKEAAGRRLTSLVGYTLAYNTLDNAKNPTDGLYSELRQDFAGAGGNAKFIRTTGDVRFYYPLYDDVIGLARVQAGNMFAWGGGELRIMDNFNMGPALVRGFAPGGIGPRDITDPNNLISSSLGGTNYVGGTLEAQFPILGLPKEVGLKGALFADAGTLFGYKGTKDFSSLFGNLPGHCANGAPGPNGINTRQPECITVRDNQTIRSSVGASLLWASPLGPIRFDFAKAITKDQYDRTQFFRFSGGTSF